MGMSARTWLRAGLAAPLTCGIVLVFGVSAYAEAPNLLLRIPESGVAPGSGAGELDNPRGAAADRDSGHLYVADRRNGRVAEYTAWGLFVKAWGWDVAPDGAPGDTPGDQLETCGPAAPLATPDLALCQKGALGTGRGQFALLAGGMALDGDGNVWVGDHENRRLQKFSSAGEFQVMLGGDVNRTKVEAGAPVADRDVCPVDPGDICQAGTSGSGPSQLPSTSNDVLAFNPDLEAVVVGGHDRIQIFDLDGSYREEIAFEGNLAAFDGKTVTSLDTDSAGNLYIALSGLPDIYKLSATGVPLAPGQPSGSSFHVIDPARVAVDSDGTVYAIEASLQIGDPGGRYIVGYEKEGTPVDGMEPADEFGRTEVDAFPHFAGPFTNDLTGITTNMCPGSSDQNLYAVRANILFEDRARSYVSAYGPGPVGCEPPPKRSPVIEAQYGVSAGTHEATVQAQINPKFWADTSYYVEYGTGKCSEGGCDKQQPLPTGPVLTEKVTNATLKTAGVRLTELVPGVIYHYRFVAQSGGGGPVFGVDPDGEGHAQGASFQEGLEGTLRTFRRPPPPPLCPNNAFRGGPGAGLPDCRAYEIVSPLERTEGDAALLPPTVAFFQERNQSATSGERFTYSSITAFGDPESAPFVSQYLSEREPEGWATEAIAPPRTSPPLSVESGGMINEFQAFSRELCSAWLRHNSSATLAPEAIDGFANIYRRDNCSEPPLFEALTMVEPPHRSPAQYFPLLIQGVSDDVTHVIFTADDQLHSDAPNLGPQELRLYEHLNGKTRFVCYLPNGQPTAQACSAGTAAGQGGGTKSSLRNTISADGSRIFWTAYSGEIQSKSSHPGTIYARIDGDKTIEVSGAVTTEPAFFWTAAEDGSTVIFEIVAGPLKDNLYEFNVDAETPTLIAKGVQGPLGASEDASRIYFASTEDFDESGPASKGNLNLYLYEAALGEFNFVITLSGRDLGGLDGEPASVEVLPSVRSAAVSPDGLHAVFGSAASPAPSGYDNLDAVDGQPDGEVYRYDAGGAKLLCLSCNPTGVRPTGENGQAARLQARELALHAPRVLSSDGSRVFFESHEALVPRDTNGAWDVYQWEEPGKGTCDEGDATFHETNGGCIDLISSGESPADSKFLDADPSGDNVFIGTQSSLIGADYGLNDVYVARVGGGFPEPQTPVECEGETCPTPKPPPAEVTPPSGTAKPGNEVAPKSRPRPCPKGKRRIKRKGKVRCVPRKAPRKGAARRRGGRA